MNLIKHLMTNKARAKYKELGLSEILISIFIKQKKYRTLQDNLYLIQNYEYFDCFQKILKNYKEGELMLETIFKKLDFVLFDPGKVIYSSNDIISNMFYIFYGSVKIDKNKVTTLPKIRSPKKMKNKKIKYKGELDVIKEKKEFRQLAFTIKLINAMKKNLIKKESDLSDMDFNDNEIILSKGDEYGFDEINENRRKYTVVTKSSCIIGFLSKEDWQYIFEKTDVIKKNDMLKFLEGLQIFKNRSSDKIIYNIYNSINEKHVNIGETLVNYEEDLKKFYIIRKGYFQVEIKIKEKIKNAFNDISSFGNYNNKEKTENIKYEAKNYYTQEDNFKIITYGKGEFLGDIEFYLDSKKYLTKILCKSSSSVVYEIKYEDLMTYMTPNLKETLLKEGKLKLEYFRKRINEMKIMKSTKINNKNKYKQIILNKLEEEKGEIFNDMENKTNGLFLYELKRRKRLKTASFNKNMIDIYENNDYMKNKFKYKNYINKMKQTKNKIRRNYLSIYNKDNIKFENKLIFPTSVKKNKTNLRLYKENKLSNNNYKDSPSKILNTILSNSMTPNNKGKILPLKGTKMVSISPFLNSVPNKTININNIKAKNEINSVNKKNLKTVENELSPKVDIIKRLLSRKFIPKTPNEKILKAYSILCKNEAYRKNDLIINEAIGINYYNTQEYSFLRTNDKSLNDNESSYNSNIFNNLKKDKNNNNKFNLKKTIPLLTEIVCNKKEMNLKGLYSKKYKNYNVNY